MVSRKRQALAAVQVVEVSWGEPQETDSEVGAARAGAGSRSEQAPA